MSKIAVIYWSGTGNTAIMANEIAAGIGTDAEVFSVDAFHGNVADYDKIAFGCSAMGDEVLEEAEFEPFFTAVEGSLKGKKVALFGSYGWGSGEWMDNWKQRTKDAGATIIGTAIVNETPDNAPECKELGELAAKA